jgi:hypothetical protein
MADPSPADLIALLARYGADGILEAPQVLSAIRSMSAEQAGPDPGAAALLAALAEHRDSAQAPMPAIDALISHVKQLRLSAAERFHGQHGQDRVDFAEFETLLGDLPLKESLAAVADDPSNRVLESAISLARDRQFLSSRRHLAPTAAAELDRRFDEVAVESFAVLENADCCLVFEIIKDLRRQVQAGLDLKPDPTTANSLQALGLHLDQVQIAAETISPREPDRDSDHGSNLLRSLERQFQAASTPLQRQQALDRICVWPGAECFEVIQRLVEANPEVCERVGLILTCRLGSQFVSGWSGWENALNRATGRSQHDLRQLVGEAPAELLLIWVKRIGGVDPKIISSLEHYCQDRIAAIGEEDFVERWTEFLPASEFNALLGVEIEDVSPVLETVTPIEPQPAAADKPRETRPSSPPTDRPAPAPAPVPAPVPAPSPAPVAVAPVEPPKPPTASSVIWRDHIQPWLTENWYLVAGVVMVVAGASLISVYFWDRSPEVKYTLLPALLAGFTIAVAAAGSWIERQDKQFRGTAALLRGAAVALLPLNFMVVSLLADTDLASRNVLVAVMGLVYLVLFGWVLRSWCRAVHEPLGLPLAGALLAINGLVMIGPLARTLAGSDPDGLKLPTAIGFHAGFALVAWIVVRFANRILTPELAREKRVPWFVGGTLAAAFLQVFGWVHFQLGQLPHVSTYALLMVLVGWLILFVERRAIELEEGRGRLGSESFLGYALVLMGVLMGTAQEHVRVAVFALAGVVWLYQAMRRNHELQHWIGLTLLSLSGASVALLTGFPRDPWLPIVGLLLSLLMGGLHWLGRTRSQPLLARAAVGMQPTLALLTAVVAILAQWQFRSPPLLTAGVLLAVVAIFAWRAWRDEELRWVHSAMAIVGLTLPYLGCVDMLGRQLHGNTMVFGLAVTSCGWLVLVWLTKSNLLRQARSTVLMVFGSIAVAAMVLRVLFEGGPPATLQPWQQLMDYSGPLLMAVLLAIATYHMRSLLPAVMAAVIAVILFPELRARFEESFTAIGWGSGLGGSLSGLGLVLACFPLARAGWLRDLGEGDRFFGRIPFPFRRYDHTLFTWPLTASAVFLSVRVDTWAVLQNALPGQSIGNLLQITSSLIPLKTAFAVCVSGVTWTLLAVLYRSRRGAVIGVHLGWITLLAGLLLGNHLLDTPWHWSWPVLVTGLILQLLDLVYSRLKTTQSWIEASLTTPTRSVLAMGSLVLSTVCVIGLILHDASQFRVLAVLIGFVAIQLVRFGLVTGRTVFGGFLFVLTLVSLLSLTSVGEGHLLRRLSLADSLAPTLWLLLGVHVVHIGLEFARSTHERLRPLLAPFLLASSLLAVVLIVVNCFSTVLNLEVVTSGQRWMLLSLTLLAARNHGSGWLGLLGLLQAYLHTHVLAGELERFEPGSNIEALAEPWRCATLGLLAAVLGQAGRLLGRDRSSLLIGPFAQPVFRSPRVAWLFVPAVGFSLFATAYHTAVPVLRAESLQLWAPYLSTIGLVIVAWSWRSQSLAWLATAMVALGNIHSIRLYPGDTLIEQGLSEMHLASLGLVATLLQLSVMRELWRRDRVAAFVNRASLLLAGLVLVLICFNYVTDPGLADIRWERFVVSGIMAYIAALYFRSAARRPGEGEKVLVASCEAGYHFGVTLAIWCAALLIPALREPTTALFALAIPVVYFYARAEQGFASGFALARRYRDSAAALSFAIIGLWVFRVAFHLLMFPGREFDFETYHTNAPLILLLSIVMLRLHGLGGTSWLGLYGGLALVVGSFFTLTWIEVLRPLEHPIATAWCAIGLAHFWTLVSHQRSPLRTAVLRLGRIDGPDWFRFRRTWGVFLLIATHVATLWGLCESFGVAGFDRSEAKELLATPLLLGAASVVIHMGVIRHSVVYIGVGVFEIALAVHSGFLGIESYLPADQVVWVVLGLWAAGLVAWEFASRQMQTLKLGTISAGLAGLTMLHIVLHHHPDTAVGLWAFAVLVVLTAMTPRSTHSPRSGEESVAAGLLLVAPTWLVFFSQARLSDGFGGVVSTWPLLATTAAVFTTGSLCRWFQVRLLPGYDAWERPQPRLFDQTLAVVGKTGRSLNSITLWLSFAVAVVVQLTHYREAFQTREVVLLCLLFAGFSVGWFYEGQQRRTMSAYIVLQLCVLGFFTVLRRQLINTTEFWTPQYDVWASLVVSFGLCGAKQVIDVRPREIRIPLMGTLLGLPVVALIWVLANDMDSGVALLVVGLHSLMFTFLGKDDRESPYNIVAVGGFVAFVLITFWTQLELKLLHAYVIPVGLGILVLLQLFSGRIDIDTRNRVRMVSLLAMLTSAGYYPLVSDDHPVAFNLTLIVLCLVSMGLGSFLRIRLYLFLGFAGLLVDVASIIFKVVRVADLTTQRAAIGVVLLVIGIGLVGGTMYYKTRRDQINVIIDRWRGKLGGWE